VSKNELKGNRHDQVHEANEVSKVYQHCHWHFQFAGILKGRETLSVVDMAEMLLLLSYW
jgi:hypothetical protein